MTFYVEDSRISYRIENDLNVFTQDPKTGQLKFHEVLLDSVIESKLNAISERDSRGILMDDFGASRIPL